MNLNHSGIGARVGWIGCLTAAGLTFLVIALVPSVFAQRSDKQEVHLYFADAKRPFLVSEPRVMVNSGDPILFGRQLMTELIKGSAGGNLATIPAGTQLRAFFLLDDGTAVVDFTDSLRKNHPGGCRREQLTLFSIVNSLTLNVPEIDRVKILINGADIRTLTGHVPLDFPLTADLLLTR